jgi:hypothetical protein
MKWATIGGVLFAIMIEVATWDKLGFDVDLVIIGFVGGFLITLMIRLIKYLIYEVYN